MRNAILGNDLEVVLEVIPQHCFRARALQNGSFLFTPGSRQSGKSSLGSLGKRVFETPMATGSELFSLLTCPHTPTFTLLSIFSPLEMSSIKI